MSETRRTAQLYLGKCIEDLEKLYNVPDLKDKKAKMLCNTAKKLFEKAEKCREKGDEETSYVCYMKYLRLVSWLSKDPEYNREKKFFNDLLGVKNPNKAISAAEILKGSLVKRYESLQKTQRLHDIKENEYVKQKIEEERTRMMEVQAHKEHAPALTAAASGLPNVDDVTITCHHLYSLLKEDRHTVMILDTRSHTDFQKSHVDHLLCISVPEQFITPGQSANTLEGNLPVKSKLVWPERGAMDLIVLLDWSSTAVIPGKPLHLLKTILLKWDVKTHYRRPPVALEGGYEGWLLRYPSLTTNPTAARPPPPDHLMEEMLGDIDYPSWTDVSPASAPPPASAHGNPIVDRSSKPAAIQTYEERARGLTLLLDRQERIADTSLSLEMQRVEAEQDWETVRAKQELEAKEELKASYKLREQEIISQLMQLESKQYDMAQENQNLREQLEEYQRREREESTRLAESAARTARAAPAAATTPPLTDSGEAAAASGAEAERALVEALAEAAARELAAKRARIRDVEEQREALDRTRELLEAERKKKLAEARDKKKPALRKEAGGDGTAPPRDGASAAGLNRSQSSPNIAKMSPEDEPPTPQFDRSVKPRVPAAADFAAARQRDFQPVWGDVGHGLTGLKNLGNTCYMNSIIQCLNNTGILKTYFCNGQYREHVNRSGHGTRGAVAEELAAVVRALWSGQYRFIATEDLRMVVGKHQRTFSGGEQQDSHEFLTILMDWLHLDLQIPIHSPHKDSLPPPEKAWQEYTKSKESVILRLFYGQIKSTVRCTVCDEESVTYESFSNLSLELPANANRCCLSDCLQLYLNGETIPGWNCPSCKEKRNALKKLDISRLPPVLVIHFKRFYADPKDYNYNSYRKKQTYIDFPLEELDMGQFALRGPGTPTYSLYGVSNHYGSMEGGHYTAYCKSNVYGKWYKFDDHVVSEISASDVRSSAAYILFYTSYNQTL